MSKDDDIHAVRTVVESWARAVSAGDRAAILEHHAQRVFNALADGGKITMPLQPTFWAKTWGMLIDKFGTPWIVNGERVPF